MADAVKERLQQEKLVKEEVIRDNQLKQKEIRQQEINKVLEKIHLVDDKLNNIDNSSFL